MALLETEPTAPRVLVVDDDPLAARTLGWVVEQSGFEVGYSGSEPKEISEEIDEQAPDLLMIDLRLSPGAPDGIQVATAMAQRHPGVVVVLCTASENPDDAARALEAGIGAYLSKGWLLRAAQTEISFVLTLAQGGAVVYLVNPHDGHRSVLSDRQREVLGLRAQKLPHREIASRLCLSEKTVDSHLNQIRHHLGASSVDQAVVMASERGWI